MVLNAIKNLAQQRQLSSWHLLFPEEGEAAQLVDEGLHLRTATQFHWYNEGFSCFDDFLSTFSSRKRKNLKKERKRVAEQGFEFQTLTGSAITPEQWARRVLG